MACFRQVCLVCLVFRRGVLVFVVGIGVVDVSNRSEWLCLMFVLGVLCVPNRCAGFVE